jgi:hypothetical protein
MLFIIIFTLAVLCLFLWFVMFIKGLVYLYTIVSWVVSNLLKAPKEISKLSREIVKSCKEGWKIAEERNKKKALAKNTK